MAIKQTHFKQFSFSATSQTIWDSLTQPHPSIQNEERRRQARLISVTAIIAGIMLILGAIASGDTPQIIASIFIWGAYTLSRTRYSQVAGIVILHLLMMPTFSAYIIAANTYPGEPVPVYASVI